MNDVMTPMPGDPMLALVYRAADGSVRQVEVSQEILQSNPRDIKHWDWHLQPALYALRYALREREAIAAVTETQVIPRDEG